MLAQLSASLSPVQRFRWHLGRNWNALWPVADYDISGLRQRQIAGLIVVQYEDKYFQSKLYIEPIYAVLQSQEHRS